ncbi:ABC-F family ATP-binding cassette domain-containing protein [Flammeovirga kamogawensis]|uniref:ATP-binding cassette domain-containing protein n=1 Tax=Flammeovirga kamogawensis TaxID=373891 RepID=A0ABX8H0K7_9BACT|nr:ABC-F family ATP-binding cassette domain-containing protein [Flammeovirga kamogawensis]MBB6459297.1 ATPase subunit of ABC transporter with duplicated ATPase domains [Flammeovirga kamogawensis]QWG08857.1 ATP-binding cassette domain-containing protein [Flammeovirga kamogawensis]TRX67147.1 ABC-F family ATP-binding cassette domain-containing protein [Flammeovirga kamogawensis]
MLSIQELSYLHPNKDVLFQHLNCTINTSAKVALIGNNGSGKSTLLKIISGELLPSSGTLKVENLPYYVPQIFGQFNHLTIAQSLKIENKLNALSQILNGDISEENYAILNDDWTIEERCKEALEYWQLFDLDLSQKLSSLSGGQKTKVFLAGILIHQPSFFILDEPSNHMDSTGRKLLYTFIEKSKSTIIVVSHDRKLLNLIDTTYELSPSGISIYGGNYDFYKSQKEIEKNALNSSIQNTEKALRKAKEKERETRERKEKVDARGKKKQIKSGVPKVMMNKMKNDAENSSSKLSGVHQDKIGGISKDLHALRSNVSSIDKMKFGFNKSTLHKGKLIFNAININIKYNKKYLWKEDLTIEINSGERIAIKGNNGTGKTTLIKLILGSLSPENGTFKRAENKSVYIDQDYSLIDSSLTVYEQVQKHNSSALLEHEVKVRLNRFLFPKEEWDKPCSALSGGERMRLMLCCLTVNTTSPDIIILDEPTNNLDIQNIEILTAAILEYQGTLLVVSHDDYFLEKINIERTIELK